MVQGPVNEATDSPGPSGPSSGTTRLLDFEAADIEAIRTTPQQFMLVVTGETPFVGVNVELVPRTYVARPDYWGIEVIGRIEDQHVRRAAPFTASLLLSDVTGTRGVEVIGCEGSVRLDVPTVEDRNS